jgi:hypothetical protein
MHPFRMKSVSFRPAVVLAFILLCVIQLSAQSASAPLAKTPLPPLGWSSWNSFSNTINSDATMQQAKAMVDSGLQKSGYQYIDIDEGWWMGNRDAEGNIVVDPKMWPAIVAGEKPGDMANIARYIHSLGLKAGIYTDAGKDGCSMYPDLGPAYFHVGSEGHYEQDFLQFAKWGFDFVKVDWCGGDKEHLSSDVQYSEIARAISRAEQITGKRLYYSICNGGSQSPWTWGPGIGGLTEDIWRVSSDIVAPVVANSPNGGRKVDFDKMLRNFDQGIHPEAQHTGYYNDPDMMVLGMPGLNAEQNRLHMSLWSISGAPLIIGADLSKLDAETSATLKNPDAIAIDQDPLGLECMKVKELSPGLEVWSKFLSTPGSRAVLLMNRTPTPAPMSIDWAELGLTGDSASVKDVWAGKNIGRVAGTFQATVPAQGGVLLIVKGKEGSFAHYTPDAVISAEEKALTSPQTVFAHIAQVSSLFAQVKIVYTNTANSTQVIELYVNGETGTRVAFPPTGGSKESVWVQAKLDRANNANILNFATDATSSFKVESVEVH